MSFDGNVVDRFNDIKRADNDHKLYKDLVLSNKMKILLISDSKTGISFAAMNVNIEIKYVTGYNCDTWPLLGLAHLCEHMLSMGTKKFSAQDDYDMYVSQSNGQQNAMTSLNSTNYYFTVTPDKLNGALDRFAQFFIAPLFDEDLIETAIHNIDSEFNEMVTEEKCRLIGLEKVSIKMDHPYSKFGLGDKETLDELPKKMKINVRTKLKEFYKKYYSANIMSLCILSKGCHVRFEEENKVLKTSSTIVYYSTGLRSTESNMLLLLSNQIINQRTFHILRINYNLGYTVFSQVTKMDATQYLTVVVQGNRYPPYVENVIDTLFMENMYEHICTMSKEEFENYKKGLESHLTAFKTRSSQCTLYWKEIESQEYNFDREAIEVDYLKKITQEQLRKFFEVTAYFYMRTISFNEKEKIL
ncbi:Insulin-degrading enzyme [Temnothorax longispinosus]|uniref:Insulin-degrading enzyme n=1 Tax=Temnothorax longispinosus TaxID=300112 RepID=A0A4S2KQZ2_9HYME|nr:Insulin-degrading enzyme [Temnothorax longispinosus]